MRTIFNKKNKKDAEGPHSRHKKQELRRKHCAQLRKVAIFSGVSLGGLLAGAVAGAVVSGIIVAATPGDVAPITIASTAFPHMLGCFLIGSLIGATLGVILAIALPAIIRHRSLLKHYAAHARAEEEQRVVTAAEDQPFQEAGETKGGESIDPQRDRLSVFGALKGEQAKPRAPALIGPICLFGPDEDPDEQALGSKLGDASISTSRLIRASSL